METNKTPSVLNAPPLKFWELAPAGVKVPPLKFWEFVSSVVCAPLILYGFCYALMAAKHVCHWGLKTVVSGLVTVHSWDLTSKRSLAIIGTVLFVWGVHKIAAACERTRA